MPSTAHPARVLPPAPPRAPGTGAGRGRRWTAVLLLNLGLVAAAGVLARRRARRGDPAATPLLEIVALACCCGVLVAVPTAVGLRTQITLLFVLVLLAPAVVWLGGEGPGERRRLLSPLVIFALAFVLVLGPRAILLARGDPGRFFVLDASTGTTVSAFISPPETRHARTYSAVRNPSVETTTRDWGDPVSNASAGFAGSLVRRASDGYEGSASAEARVRTGTGASYIAVSVGEALEAKADVRPGRVVSGALAVKALAPHPAGRLELRVAYYGADSRYIADDPLTGPGSMSIRAHPAPGHWYRLYGTSRVRRGAAFANLVLVVRGFENRQSVAFRLDAARLEPNARSRTDYPLDAPPNDGTAIWSDAAVRALAVSIAMLLTVFVGFLLPLGARISRLVPELRLLGLRDRRTARVLVALTGVGLVAYVVEMGTYGGYGGYLAAFSSDPTGGLGKFYIRTLATLSTGAAVVLLARRIWVGRGERVRLLEVGIIGLGFGIAVSYLLKAVIIIPLLTVLLFWHFARRRAVIWLGMGAAAFAVLTPFVYQVRSEGSVRISDLFASSYWSEFPTNLQSRFFHFESLMILMPYGNRGAPWQPFADFFSNVVPRVLWHDKPLSLDARFTNEYLYGGLHARSDVGVISLPGELWLIGGWAGVIVAGIAFGVLLRWVHAMIASPSREPGTLLLAVTVLTFLVFANDGWGLASSAISVLILAVGWLAPLRRVRHDDQAGAEPVELARDRLAPRATRRS